MLTDQTALRIFLVEAKRHTYAGHGHEQEFPSRPGSRDFSYTAEDYLYLDSQLGRQRLVGQEVVWHRRELIWAMNYYGCLLAKTPVAGFSYFLKAALRAVLPEHPYRGPERFEQEEFLYCCQAQGSLAEFYGKETICYQGSLIYELRFHGGTLG